MNGLFKSSLAVLLVVVYALASHLALTLPGGQSIAAVLAIGIPAIIAIVWIFQCVFDKLTTKTAETVENNLKPLNLALRVAVACVVAIVPVLVFLYATWPLMLANAEAVYFVQHVGTNALLAWVFGRTLADGSTPLIASFAKIIHPTLPTEIEEYARKVTVAWVWFFILTCVISVLLYVSAPLALWSGFAILLQWPSVALFFVGEYLLRKKLFKKFDHATLRQGFDAYRQSQTTSMNAVNVVKAEQSQ
jgi:uncharacterized membrane protein